MSEPNESLSPRLARLVEAERECPDVPSAIQRRLLARLDATVAGGGGGPPGGSSAPPRVRPWMGRVPFGTSLFVLGAVAGAALHAAWTTRAAVAPKVNAAVNSPPPAAAPPPEPTPSPPSPAARPIKKASRSPQHDQASGPREESLRHDDELTAERAALEIARAALARGQPEAAIDALRRHARAYPNGRLAEERDSLWIVAFVQAELYPEARRRAERFRRDYPQSLFLPAVEQSLKGIP